MRYHIIGTSKGALLYSCNHRAAELSQVLSISPETAAIVFANFPLAHKDTGFIGSSAYVPCLHRVHKSEQLLPVTCQDTKIVSSFVCLRTNLTRNTKPVEIKQERTAGAVIVQPYLLSTRWKTNADTTGLPALPTTSSGYVKVTDAAGTLTMYSDQSPFSM